jgi:hypothetical protein
VIPEDLREELSRADPPSAQAAIAPPVKQESTGKALAWLWCDPLPPLPVGLKPMLLLGRSRDCDMILPHASVSRKHATVTAVEGSILLKNRSSYGTLVNGKAVDSVPLKPGDLIVIGPYMIQVSATRSRHRLGEEATQPLQFVDGEVALSGSLSHVPMVELLQQLEFNSRTGTLKVFDERTRRHGLLVIKEGRPLHAEVANLEGTAAALQLLAVQAGQFTFSEAVEGETNELAGQTITGLLLESQRRVDEESQAND